jgi:tellurite resistance protein TehA-like permease
MDIKDLDEIESKILREEMRRTKKQQWQVASYIVLIQAALIAFHRLVNESNADKINKWVFPRLNQASIILSIAILILGLLLIIFYGFRLYQYRKLIKETAIESMADSKFSKITNLAIEAVIYLVFLVTGICSTYLAFMFIRFCK